MSVNLIVNDLSYPLLANSVQARELMANFILSIKEAVSRGAKGELRLTREIENLELCPNYSISMWRNDPLVARDMKTYFRTLATKTPCLIDFTDLNEESLSVDVFHNNKNTEALKAVYLLDGLSISLDSSVWLNHIIDCDLQSIVGTDLVNSLISLKNISIPGHAINHQAWMDSKKITGINSMEDLKQRNPFPNIIFCKSSFKFLDRLSTNDEKFIQFLKKVKELNEKAPTLVTNDYSKVSFKLTGESQTTMEQHGQERVFTDPTGNELIFEDHFRIPGNWRCHIYFDSIQKKFLIGYVGPHLTLA